jgi:hypothetical protein
MNENLKHAFEHIAHGREALNRIIEEPGFHSPTWQAAFTQTFDRLESLKTASPRDAAILGPIFIGLVGGLIDQLIEEEENQILLPTLCTMTSYTDGLRRAERFLNDVLHDLEDAHTPLTLAILQQHGCGQECLVYGACTLLLGPKPDLRGAVFIHVDPASTGYETSVVVKDRLDPELFRKYELDIVSRPFDRDKE